MAERNVREPEQPINYAMLSLFQYTASILVILVHQLLCLNPAWLRSRK